MGNVCGGSDPKQKVINQEIEKDRQADETKLKLLLLGAGESGKSTLFKQMKILYSKSRTFNDIEKDTYREGLFHNVFHDFFELLKVVEFQTPEATEAAAVVQKKITAAGGNKKVMVVDRTLGELLRVIWSDVGMRKVWKSREKIQVQDSLEYFMKEENISRIEQEGYSPTNEDILRIRVRTSGIVSEKFLYQGANLEMYDVGGQQSERKKWIGAFDGITSVIFVAAISEYNQVMFEDSSISRQSDALELFRNQLHMTHWLETPFILFLNKSDLFREKLARFPFRVAEGPDQRNVDFQGPYCDPKKEYRIDGTDQEFEACYTAASEYLRDLYVSQGEMSERKEQVYPNFTNSTDTKQMEHILDACKVIILKQRFLNL